eukprot:scaffold4031_cov141-Skeletonema_menzelii.AAC.6
MTKHAATTVSDITSGDVDLSSHQDLPNCLTLLTMTMEWLDCWLAQMKAVLTRRVDLKVESLVQQMVVVMETMKGHLLARRLVEMKESMKVERKDQMMGRMTVYLSAVNLSSADSSAVETADRKVTMLDC